MNHLFRPLAACLGLGLLCALAPASALAAATNVTYLGDTNVFAEPPGQDLFVDFKGVMPGDTLTQTVHLHNRESQSQTVQLFLRADAPDAAGKDFLSRLGLTVSQGGTLLFSAPADQTDGLSANVLLGTFNTNADWDLTVRLTVPTSLDNTFAEAAGAVDWVFTAQNTPAATPTPAPTASPTAAPASASPHRAPGVPQTGDTGPAPLLPAGGAAAALAGLAVLKRRKNRP